MTTSNPADSDMAEITALEEDEYDDDYWDDSDSLMCGCCSCCGCLCEWDDWDDEEELDTETE